jgi:hypothetical protein
MGHTEKISIAIWVSVVLLSLLLFGRNYASISQNVSLCNSLYSASISGGEGFETAVVARDGKVLRPTRLIDASNVEGARFREKDVLSRLKERSATGGGYLEIYDCHARKLQANTVYVNADKKGNFRVTSRV